MSFRPAGGKAGMDARMDARMAHGGIAVRVAREQRLNFHHG